MDGICAGQRLTPRDLGVEPAEVMFVDDMPECLEGARATGIGALVRAAWFVDRPTNDHLPVWTAQSPVAVLEYVKG